MENNNFMFLFIGMIVGIAYLLLNNLLSSAKERIEALQGKPREPEPRIEDLEKRVVKLQTETAELLESEHSAHTAKAGTYFYIGQFEDERAAEAEKERRAVVDRMKNQIHHETSARPPTKFLAAGPNEIPAELAEDWRARRRREFFEKRERERIINETAKIIEGQSAAGADFTDEEVSALENIHKAQRGYNINWLSETAKKEK